MKKIIKMICELYKKLYKNNPGKTKMSRYIYGLDMYKKLDQREKIRIKKSIKKYKPNVRLKSIKYYKVFLDLAFSKKYYQCSNDEYFMFDFYHKNDKLRKTFITGIAKREYIHLLNTDDAIEFLRDKYSTYELLKDFYGRDVIEIKSQKDYKIFEDFTNKHQKFIKKSNNLSCGKGIEIKQIADENKKDVFYSLLDESESTVIEELVNQSEEMAILHPESVNTIRIITFLDEDNSIKIKYSFLRIGVEDSVVDNGGAGGIICLIDDETGNVITDGVDEEFNWYKVHPDTGIKLKDFSIPNWREACELAKKAQKKVKGARLIGWDLAYTNKGWIIIEGNGHTQFIGQQIADQVGKKEPFEKMIHYKKLKQNYKKNEYKYKFSVIIPIYNSEKYIDETIKSVINQTIGFKENIQLIMINDGSSDNSEKICKNYQKQYPDNIKYIYQKNKGVSSARNEGMKYIEGKYVNFLDSDDKWDKNAFKEVWDFFTEKDTRIDLVTCRQKFFEAKSGFPNLDYKFNEAKSYVVDINKNPDFIVLSVSSTFFKVESLKNKEFDIRLNYGEDAKFLTQVLLEKERYGLVKDAYFYLRKRKDDTSLTQNSKTDITRYTNTIDYYYKYLIELSNEKYHQIIPYIEHVIINGIKFRICNQVPSCLSEKEKEKYIKNIIEILNNISIETIIKTRNINQNIKYYILKLRSMKSENNCFIDKNMNIICNDMVIGKLTGNKKLFVSSLNIIDSKLIMKGMFKFPNYISLNDIYISCNDKKYTLSFDNSNNKNKLSFKDETITEIKDFTLEISNLKNINKIMAYFETDKDKIELAFEFDEKSILQKLNKGYLKINNYMIIKKGKNHLLVKKYNYFTALKYKIKK